MVAHTAHHRKAAHKKAPSHHKHLHEAIKHHAHAAAKHNEAAGHHHKAIVALKKLTKLKTAART